MAYHTLTWNVEDGIGHLVLAQPPANTMTGAFFQELGEVTRDVIPGSGARALVIYGQGRHFSAGADPVELKERIRKGLPKDYPLSLPGFLSDNMASFQFIEELTIPTFAAIRGTCLGSGLELALYCKYRICGEGAVLGFPESSFGLMPGCGGSVKLPSITGTARAIELLLSGRNFLADEAEQQGIVHKVVARSNVIDETVKAARRMISHG